MAKVRFAIVGCGAAAIPVAAALAESPVAALAVCHDRDPALAGDLAGRHGAAVAASLAEALENSQVDAVYIAVPHAHLAPLARQALQAGKHALVEKPMALTLADVDDLAGLASARGLALGVFYELRYNAAVVQARALVQQGAIGTIQGVRIQTLIDKPLSYWQAGYSGRSQDPWRGRRDAAGGGVVLMNSSHLLDAVWHLTGLEVTRVSAEVGTLAAAVEVEDTAAAVLRYQGGAIGSLMAGAHVAGAQTGDERFDLYGSQGQLALPDPYSLDPLRLYLRRPWQGLPANCWTDLPAEPAPQTGAVFPQAIGDFARAAQAGQPAPIGPNDARRALATVLAIYQSAAAGRAIDLPAGLAQGEPHDNH
jgi:UDP-N-acetyl-2-amino-2-deoxyglucuronate dehydrogenase